MPAALPTFPIKVFSLKTLLCGNSLPRGYFGVFALQKPLGRFV
jgi:hypothetical protein